MKRILTIATVFLLAFVVATAGCVSDDGDDDPASFAGDPITGFWVGELIETFETTDRFEPYEAVTTFDFGIEETGYVAVSYSKVETGEDVWRTTTEDTSGTLTKVGEYEYLLEIDNVGTYSITYHEVGLATLTAPSGFECELTQ